MRRKTEYMKIRKKCDAQKLFISLLGLLMCNVRLLAHKLSTGSFILVNVK